MLNIEAILIEVDLDQKKVILSLENDRDRFWMNNIGSNHFFGKKFNDFFS